MRAGTKKIDRRRSPHSVAQQTRCYKQAACALRAALHAVDVRKKAPSAPLLACAAAAKFTRWAIAFRCVGAWRCGVPPL
jgi:hypothetical protein